MGWQHREMGGEFGGGLSGGQIWNGRWFGRWNSICWLTYNNCNIMSSVLQGPPREKR